MSAVTRPRRIYTLPPLLLASAIEVEEREAKENRSQPAVTLIEVPPMPVKAGPLPFHLDPRDGYFAA